MSDFLITSSAFSILFFRFGILSASAAVAMMNAVILIDVDDDVVAIIIIAMLRCRPADNRLA